MDDSDFLKRELSAQAKKDKKFKYVKIGLSLFIFIIVLSGLSFLPESSNRQENEKAENRTVQQHVEDESDSTGENETHEPNSQQEESIVPSESQAEPQDNHTQSNNQQTYTPQSQDIDKTAFIADGEKLMGNYGQIVELVTFPSSISDEEKADRIKQALELDEQHFNQVTRLRSNLVTAEVTSGPYMEATELAEDGIAKISVGLTFMNYWADDHSRTSDLQSGANNIAEGADTLSQFSQKLTAL